MGRVGARQDGWSGRSQRLLNVPQRAANGSPDPAAPLAGDVEAQNGSERVDWWRRVFGG